MLLTFLVQRNLAFFAVLVLLPPLTWLLLQTPFFFGDTVVTIGIFFLLIMGLDLLYGYAGQLSLGHQGFFAIGAYTLAILSVRFGLSPWIAGLLGLLGSGLLAASLGGVLLRLTGLYFMLGTLAFGIIVHAILIVWHPVTGGEIGLGGIPRPFLGPVALDTDLAYGALVWGLAFPLFWFALNLGRSRIGRALRAIRGDELAAGVLGLHVGRLKLNAFIISALYASLAGSLFAAYIGAVHPESFTLAALLEMLLMLFLGGEGTIWGVLLGVILLRMLPELAAGLDKYKILFNGFLFTLVLFCLPEGLASGVRQLASRARLTPRSFTIRSLAASSCSAGDSSAVSREGALLELYDLGKAFGGVRAVDGVSFAVRAGGITSVIGPNGAGKTTLLNLVSGVYRPDRGRIVFLGRDVTGWRSDQIALLGVGRTFQNPRLFERLTVLENVMVGGYRRPQGDLLDLVKVGMPLRRVLAEELELAACAMRALALVGLKEQADTPVGALPYGHRKLVELARAAAASPHLLLLDEVAAGLNPSEKEAFKLIIRELQRAGMTIVLVEHDMDFVMELSDEVVVMHFGRVIAQGAPASVQQNDEVIAAYLGV